MPTLLRGITIDQAKVDALKTAADHGYTWPAWDGSRIDLTGGLTNIGMGGNGPDHTQTLFPVGWPGCGDCGPNAGPKNVDQTTAALNHEPSPGWTSDRVIRLYFLYQAIVAGVTWRPPALGAPWSADDQGMAQQLDLGVDPIDWLTFCATHDENGNVVPVGEGLVDAWIKVEPAEMEAAATVAKAVMVAVNLNPSAEQQFGDWQAGNNPKGWDVGPGDMPDPSDGHFIILGSAEADATPPYSWGSWSAFVPSTKPWRGDAVQVCIAVLTKEDAEAAGFPYAAVCNDIAAAGGTAPKGATPPAPPGPGPSPSNPPSVTPPATPPPHPGPPPDPRTIGNPIEALFAWVKNAWAYIEHRLPAGEDEEAASPQAPS